MMLVILRAYGFCIFHLLSEEALLGLRWGDRVSGEMVKTRAGNPFPYLKKDLLPKIVNSPAMICWYYIGGSSHSGLGEDYSMPASVDDGTCPGQSPSS